MTWGAGAALDLATCADDWDDSASACTGCGEPLGDEACTCTLHQTGSIHHKRRLGRSRGLLGRYK